MSSGVVERVEVVDRVADGTGEEGAAPLLSGARIQKVTYQKKDVVREKNSQSASEVEPSNRHIPVCLNSRSRRRVMRNPMSTKRRLVRNRPARRLSLRTQLSRKDSDSVKAIQARQAMLGQRVG